jgi:hypothetical protein
MGILGQIVGGIAGNALNNALGKGGQSGGKFKFPLERQDDYKGIIVFRPIKYSPPDVNFNQLKDTFKKGTDTLENFYTQASSSVKDLIGLGSNTEEALMAQSVTPSLANNSALNTIVSKSSSYVDPTRGVQLYLPQQIQYNDIIAYEQLSLGAIGGIAAAGIKAGQGAGSSLYRGASQGVTSMIDLFNGKAVDQRAARLAASRLAENLPIGEAGGGAVKSGFGVTMNPNNINLFKSVQLREFTFIFKLIASSYKESVEIENIIKFFRSTAYPDTINFDEAGLDVPIGYEFPDKFEIRMSYNGHQAGLKILPSVLRSVQVTYNPSSMGWHREGHASEVDLSLVFGEERTLTKKDIINGY